MSCYFNVVFIFSIVRVTQSLSESVSSAHDVERSRSMPVVEALFARLGGERWPASEAACRRDTLTMLRALSNYTLWAVWMWDSTQVPAGSMYGAEAYLGNYDQCLRAPWASHGSTPHLRSQYCLTRLTSPAIDQSKHLGPLDDADEYYRTPRKDGRYFNEHLFGVCLPAACPPAAAARVAQHLLALTHLPRVADVVPEDCYTAGEARNYPTGFYAFWALLGLLMAISVYATLSKKNASLVTVTDTIRTCFCLKKNFHNLFTVGSDDIKIIHGMRFITALLVVTMHEVFYQLMMPNTNGLEINELLTSTVVLSFIHIDVVVDTFFAISGLLLVRGFISKKQTNLFVFLLKRYLRLFGPYAFLIMYTVTTISHIGNGPMWKKYHDMEVEVCNKYWWKALLMLNTDVDSMCQISTWYVSCDFQLAILATFLLYLTKKKKNIGFAALTVSAVVLTVYLGLNVYWKELDILPFGYRMIRLKRSFTDVHYTYIKSHVRAGSYFVGMAMGYILTTYKPAANRNTVAKKWSIALATVSLLGMCVIVGVGAIFKDRPYSALEAALVVSTNRAVWAAAVCCIIGVCEYGSLPIVRELLGWHVFVPLSKLSYCLYLLHPLLIQHHKFTARAPHYLHLYNSLVQACGILVLGLVGSVALHLLVEAPLVNLSNKMFDKEQTHLEKNANTVAVKMSGNSVMQDAVEELQDRKTKLL